MLKIPSDIASPSFWEEGQRVMFTAIKTLREKYGIQLYIGIGAICREILQLKDSFENAKIARISVAKHHLSYDISMKSQRTFLFKKALTIYEGTIQKIFR